MAPIIEEPQTNAKNACVCATNARPQNVISPGIATDERQERARLRSPLGIDENFEL
jgi:hypothetical protein